MKRGPTLFRRFTDTNAYMEPVQLNMVNSPQNNREYTDIFTV